MAVLFIIAIVIFLIIVTCYYLNNNTVSENKENILSIRSLKSERNRAEVCYIKLYDLGLFSNNIFSLYKGGYENLYKDNTYMATRFAEEHALGRGGISKLIRDKKFYKDFVLSYYQLKKKNSLISPFEGGGFDDISKTFFTELADFCENIIDKWDDIELILEYLGRNGVESFFRHPSKYSVDKIELI